MTTDKFRDAALQQAVSNNSLQLQGFTERLNSISTDIRRLEGWLSECGLCIDVWLTVEETQKTVSTDCVVARHEKSIGWSNQETDWNHSRKWRLVYCEEDYASFRDGIVSIRPLIDSPAATRLLCSQHLPAFVEKVAASVATTDYRPLKLPPE